MVNLAMAEAVAREMHADLLKQAERARLAKLATTSKGALWRRPTWPKPTFSFSQLTKLVIRFSRA
jgi:hypothetical protein